MKKKKWRLALIKVAEKDKRGRDDSGCVLNLGARSQFFIEGS